MVSYIFKKQLLLFFCIDLMLYAWADTSSNIDASMNDEANKSARFMDKYNSRYAYKNNYKSKIYTRPSKFGKDDVSKDILRNQAAMESDDFLSYEDRSNEENYSYSPGGFYIPSEKKEKQNYFVEELDVNNTHNESKRLKFDKESPKETEAKDMKILTGAQNGGTQVTKRPSFMSSVRKLMLNPMVLTAITMVPLAFMAEIMFPRLLKSNKNWIPMFSATRTDGFARSLDSNASVNFEHIMDVINEFGARAIEDPKCLQKFICQSIKSPNENYLRDSWSVQKIARKVTNSVDDDILNRYGIKNLLDSVENGNCEVLECSGLPAYSKEAHLIEKIYLLGAKFLNQTEILHSSA
ncbi:uncharacterized protein NPIL_331371 [Nephila pilipes]|uniref:Uncharacterized protein n=1 Tax=Nephila pilipes TaxID=299642 RepID=A0A8X6TJZ5_NEPPI|nr:uncharacterized protein NPIL_331371 [Nephila pilipes]